MIYYVSANAAGCSYGTAANPFHTITEAARIAQPGDEVIVAPGIYREYVNPLHGGTDDAHRITYRSETPLGAVITGAEEIKDWTNCGGTVWSARIPNRLFGDYNPYTTLISGDWFRSPTPQHTGEVYLNGKSMYERPSLDAVKEPVDQTPVAFAFSKSDADSRLVAQMNEFILTSKENGLLEDLEEKWLNEEEPPVEEHPDYENLSGGNGTITVAVDVESKPLVYLKDNRFTGYEIEFLVLFAEEYGYQLDLRNVSFNSI